MDRIAGNDNIFALEFHQVHAELPGEVTHGGLHSEDRL